MTDRTDTHLRADLRAGVQDATDRLVRSVDRLCADPEALAAPSLLPGWSRAHVVAHLALNAEGLARVLEGLQSGEPATMYDSPEARDKDIEELATAGGTTLRDRIFGASTRFDEALAHLTDDHLDADVERTPGGPRFAVTSIPGARRTEVEVHHADLDVGYGPRDWPREFSALVLERFHTRAGHATTAFRAAPDDIVRTWEFGEPGDDTPTVSGPAWALAWWVTGRGDGEELTSSSGELPQIGAW